MSESESIPPDHDESLDISGEICPMTFVRTRLALDALQPGQVLRVRLRGAEPLRNVPRSAESLGHRELHRSIDSDGATLLWLRRG